MSNSTDAKTTQDFHFTCDDQSFLEHYEMSRDQCLKEIESLSFTPQDILEVVKRTISQVCWNAGESEKQVEEQSACVDEMVERVESCDVKPDKVMTGLEFQASADLLKKCLTKSQETTQ